MVSTSVKRHGEADEINSKHEGLFFSTVPLEFIDPKTNQHAHNPADGQ
jgi:hypothetical protein